MWRGIEGLVGEDCGFVQGGQVKVAETEAELAQLAARVAMVRALGWEHEEMLDRAALRAVLPAVAQHCVGGMAVRTDGFASPYRTVLAFRRAAEAAGVIVREGAAVRGLDRAGGLWRVRLDDETVAAPLVINAAGAWGPRIALMAGERIPIGFSAFMMLLTSPLPAFVTPVVGATGRPLSFKQLTSGHVMIGGGHKGTGDLETGTYRLDIDRAAFSARTALELFPILAGADIVHAWAGIEGVAEDEVPDWMVLGVELIADRDHLTDPGSRPGSVSLKEEDFTDPPAILESFASYLMLNFDRMAHGGYPALAERYGEKIASGGTLAEAVDVQDAVGLARLGDALQSAPWRDDTGPRL
jgi:sarcosine oxidase subunit beta